MKQSHAEDKTMTWARWQSAWRELGASHSDDKWFSEIVECYSESHRRYQKPDKFNWTFQTVESDSVYPIFWQRPGEWSMRERRILKTDLEELSMGFLCSLFSVRLTLSFRSTDLCEPFKYNIFKNLRAENAL